MQLILGAVLTAGYAGAIGAAVANAPAKDKVTDQAQSELTKSFTPLTKAAEFLVARSDVTKMIADMICGRPSRDRQRENVRIHRFLAFLIRVRR